MCYTLTAMFTTKAPSYEDAKARFVKDTFEKDGRTYARMTDPVLNLSMSIEADSRALLPQMFKGEWLNSRYRQRQR